MKAKLAGALLAVGMWCGQAQGATVTLEAGNYTVTGIIPGGTNTALVGVVPWDRWQFLTQIPEGFTGERYSVFYGSGTANGVGAFTSCSSQIGAKCFQQYAHIFDLSSGLLSLAGVAAAIDSWNQTSNPNQGYIPVGFRFTVTAHDGLSFTPVPIPGALSMLMVALGLGGLAQFHFGRMWASGER